MKTDYTLTPEYFQASLEELERSHSKICDSIELGFPIICNPQFIDAQEIRNRYYGKLNEAVSNATYQRPDLRGQSQWISAYEEARKSHAAGEPLIRTVCKIAARILFVLLVVGMAVAVMA